MLSIEPVLCCGQSQQGFLNTCVVKKEHISVKQVLLRERCLLVVSGEAYTRCEHSIPTRAKDAIAPTCCNARQARPPLFLSM